ncbi:hypothetical protein WJ75_07450 [Burkholderia ubonensis]|nr:hypothetical protein WJ75_07450 [Burkholderia ubonensis]
MGEAGRAREMGRMIGRQVAANTARRTNRASGARVWAVTRARGLDVSLEYANARFAMHAT